jgi:acetyl esterase/lipase
MIELMKRLLTLAFLAVAMMSQAQQRIDLWPQGAPHVSSDVKDTAYVQVFLPQTVAPTGRVVVICPGGGYTHLAIGHEGVDWAPVFNNMGIAAVVLKYRMPHGVKEIPFEDAEEAIRLVRRHAAEWNIDVQQVGIMGSSAGGHLASTIATHATGDAKPNFQILFYPVITMDKTFTHMGSHDFLLGANAPQELEQQYSNEKQVRPQTPRAFIVLSNDDHVVPPLNGVSYYVALNASKVPAVLHVYPTGDHGWGLRTSFAYHTEMLTELMSWLRSF